MGQSKPSPLICTALLFVVISRFTTRQIFDLQQRRDARSER